VALAALTLALVPASAEARSKVTKVSSSATVTNSSGTRVSGWKLKVRLARGTRLASATGAKPSGKKGSVALTPTRARTLAPGAKARITLVVKGRKKPSGWKVGAVACKAKPHGRQRRTALQTVTCVLPPGAGSGNPATGDPGTVANRWFPFSPYADVTLPATQSLTAMNTQNGVSHYTLAFVLASTSGANKECTPAWGGLRDDFPATGASASRKAEVEALRQAGGDVVVSFGGQLGTELAIDCTNLTDLTNAYQSVIDAYELTHVDFDVEGAATGQTQANDRRNKAIAQLQQNARAAGKVLRVSFTLSTIPTGIDDESAAVLDNAISNGVDISLVNVMAMNYGTSNAPEGETKMGEYAVEAGNAIIARLGTLYPSLSPAEVRDKVGVTSLIGQNDDQSEVFQLADRQKVVDWATQEHIGMLSMWSVARDDASCEAAHGPHEIQPDCSGVAQDDWAFARKFAEFTG
jgi:hypothetical protein